jgi:hypothetical protein
MENQLNINSEVGVYSKNTPSITAFNNKIYVTWSGRNTKEVKVVYSVDQGKSWSDKIETGRYSAAGSAICAFQGKLYITWCGENSKKVKVISSQDGNQWSDFVETGVNSVNTPAICSFNDKLHITWSGKNSKKVKVISSSDGVTWNSPVEVGGITENGPTICTFKRKLFIAWSDSGSGKINISSSEDCTSWCGVIDTGQYSNCHQSLAISNSQLMLSFKSKDNNKLLCTTSVDGSTWTASSEVGQSSTNGPNIARMYGEMYWALLASDGSEEVTVWTSGSAFSNYDGFEMNLLQFVGVYNADVEFWGNIPVAIEADKTVTVSGYMVEYEYEPATRKIVIPSQKIPNDTYGSTVISAEIVFSRSSEGLEASGTINPSTEGGSLTFQAIAPLVQELTFTAAQLKSIARSQGLELTDEQATELQESLPTFTSDTLKYLGEEHAGRQLGSFWATVGAVAGGVATISALIVFAPETLVVTAAEAALGGAALGATIGAVIPEEQREQTLQSATSSIEIIADPERNPYWGYSIVKSQTFFRFWWVDASRGSVARSSAPNYANQDSDQSMDAAAINFLTFWGITAVLSLNEYELSTSEKSALTAAGINYLHIPIKDFGVPTVDSTKEGVRFIQANNSTIIYCGYGQGRTGTMVTAWEILSAKRISDSAGNEVITSKSSAIAESTYEKPAQEDLLQSLDWGELGPR